METPAPIQKILGIETSCDETALCIIEARSSQSRHDTSKTFSFSTLATSLFSQVKIHEQYGGVFPILAKREHAKNLLPLLADVVKKTGMNAHMSTANSGTNLSDVQITHLKKMLEREPELFDAFVAHMPHIPKPDIDAIAVTFGPGLEPALWVGINAAKALSYVWNLPIIPVNHMEGHIASVLAATTTPATTPTPATSAPTTINFPALALLISGGHTEIVLARDWTDYEVLGETRDDAVGEAFDKVARMLSLPYPGGPQISTLAEKDRAEHPGTDHNPNYKPTFNLPRPMLHTPDSDFSFSGLKTAILYTLKKIPEITDATRQTIAREFEDAVVEVLIEKTKKALTAHNAKSLIIGGGVIANTKIREAFQLLQKDAADSEHPFDLYIPEQTLTTDNAVMIAMAGYIRAQRHPSILETDPETIVAEGNVRLERLHRTRH